MSDVARASLSQMRPLVVMRNVLIVGGALLTKQTLAVDGAVICLCRQIILHLVGSVDHPVSSESAVNYMTVNGIFWCNYLCYNLIIFVIDATRLFYYAVQIPRTKMCCSAD